MSGNVRPLRDSLRTESLRPSRLMATGLMHETSLMRPHAQPSGYLDLSTPRVKKVLFKSCGCKYVEVRTRVRISTYFWRLFAFFCKFFCGSGLVRAVHLPEAATRVGLFPVLVRCRSDRPRKLPVTSSVVSLRSFWQASGVDHLGRFAILAATGNRLSFLCCGGISA